MILLQISSSEEANEIPEGTLHSQLDETMVANKLDARKSTDGLSADIKTSRCA